MILGKLNVSQLQQSHSNCAQRPIAQARQLPVLFARLSIVMTRNVLFGSPAH